MATNPMQRKARNSFLLGMLLMLIISGVIIALLFMQLMNKIKAEKEALKEQVSVYVLKQNVSSGQIITKNMLEKKNVNKDMVPSNATSDLSIIDAYQLQDKEGNEIKTEVKNNKQILYIEKNGDKYELKKEEQTENYYIEKDGNKEYIELNNVPIVAKVTMKANTIITTEMIRRSDTPITDDLRKQEYNIFTLPVDLSTGDYVDIRLLLPTGQDFIVVSKKEVEIPETAGVPSSDTIWVNLTEEETINMSCAIIDAFKIKGSKLYVDKYAEPGMQEAAVPTFVLNAESYDLLMTNPNVLEEYKREIKSRYENGNVSNIRNEQINYYINADPDAAWQNEQSKMEESQTNSANSRKEYLESLATPQTTTTTTK